MELNRQLCCDLDNCQYSIVRQVCVHDLKMKEKEQDDEEWDLKWVDGNIASEELVRMKKYQKINHFPGMYTIDRKNLLAMNLNRIQKIIPSEYTFIPKTWHAPIDKFELKLYLSTRPQVYFIVKPEVGSQGRGIFLTRKLDEIDEKRHLVQEYISAPYLIEGLKFDFRIYVLITGCDPLRIFVYKEGLARFATHEYNEPNISNYSDSFMHLTNYAINRHSEYYINNKFAARDHIGHKRSLTSVLKYLESRNEDVDGLLKKIDEIVIKTLIPLQPTLSQHYHACQPDEYSNSMCFEILGFDILVDEELNPFLLEVNTAPSFATGTPLDAKIKKNLIFDCLRLVNVSVENKDKWDIRDRFMKIQRALHGISWKLSNDEKNLIKEKLNDKRREWENKHMGEFRRVYPTDITDKYDNIQKVAQDIWQKYTGIKKRPLSKLNLDIQESNKSFSYSKLDISKIDIEGVFSRLSQPLSRKIKSKFEPKVIYHYVGNSSILKKSPSSIQKIELLKKHTSNLIKNTEGKKSLKLFPNDLKLVYKKSIKNKQF